MLLTNSPLALVNVGRPDPLFLQVNGLSLDLQTVDASAEPLVVGESTIGDGSGVQEAAQEQVAGGVHDLQKTLNPRDRQRKMIKSAIDSDCTVNIM